MCEPTPPAAPDYQGAAVAQGQANKDAAIAGAQLSNPNFSNPLGARSVAYRSDPTTGNPVPFITDSYTPTGQKLFDTNIATQQSLGDLGLQGANTARGILGQQFSVGAIPGIDKTNGYDRESVYNALVARATDQNRRDVTDKESELVARGIPRGSEAWNREQDALGRNLNDARQQANLAAGAQQQQVLDSRRQMITEALANRQTPLNEISALRSGSQVAPLSFQNYSGQNVAPAPIFGATQAAGTFGQQNYQNEVAANNGMISGAAMLGAGMSGASKPWWMAA